MLLQRQHRLNHLVESIPSFISFLRINVGGLHVSSYLQRLLQLRYQALQSLISLTRSEELVHTHCFIADSYIETLSRKDWPTVTVQLPYIAAGGGGGVVGGASIDLAKQEEKVLQRRERARQHLLRLSQTKREEKVCEILFVLLLKCSLSLSPSIPPLLY